MSKCVFCFIYYNCIIILLSVTVFVCHNKGNVFLYNKFTSICILETSKTVTFGIILIIIHSCHGTNYNLIIRWMKCKFLIRYGLHSLINMPVPFSRDDLNFLGSDSMQV